ncbi:MAG: FAD-dependent oxidoreductase [Polyangiaceae bacterium]
MEKTWDVAVIGGGLSGLGAAAFLGRAGLSAVVIEKARELGGRGRTTVEHGYSLNLGAHAVYRMGGAWAALGELGVPLSGGIPLASGALALTKNGAHTLPTGLLSMLTTGLLGLSGKLEVSRTLASMGKIDPQALMGVSAREWIDRTVGAVEARALLGGLLRVSTYTGDLERLSAGAAITQMQLALKYNVLYLDGGWQTMVDALRERAVASGATILTGDGAAEVERADGDAAHPWRVRLGDGQRMKVRAAVIATGPHAAAAVAKSVPEVARLAAQTTPVKVAVLDVALSSLPRKGRTFGLGTDRATYVSVHSAVARLAPEGGAVVHAMTYAPTGDAREDEREVEDAMDAVQPGWRDHVVHKRFLPAMVAMNDLVSASRGGFEGRPDPAVAGAPGLFLAGDWIGKKGMLLDAALGSARQAAEECAAMLAGSKGVTAANGRVRTEATRSAEMS